MKTFGNGPTVLRFERDRFQNQQIERPLGKLHSAGRHRQPFHFDRNCTTARVEAQEEPNNPVTQAAGGSSVRPYALAMPTICAGLGGGEHRATSRKYSSNPPGVT